MASTTIIQGIGLQEVLREGLQEAMSRRRIDATELATWYLVHLLHAFHVSSGSERAGGEDLLARPLAVLFWEATSSGLATRAKRFRQLGDTALVLAGLYADRLRRSLVDVPYCIAMGASAYSQLASGREAPDPSAPLFAELSSKFEPFAEAISSVAPWNRAVTNAELVRIYERWRATGDEHLQEVLEEGGIVVADADEASS